MKGRIVPIAACFTVLLLSAALAACGHQHTYGAGWTYDATHHWHEATCEHGEETEGKAEHTWDGGTVTTAATCTEAGEKTCTCTVCSATKTEAIAATGHSYAKEWSSDNTHHWHAATCEHSDEQEGYGEHTYNENKVCTVCNMKYVSAGLEYTRSGDSTYYSVTGIGTCTDTEIYIPATYQGLPVKEIGEHSFHENATIKGVVLPDSITTINAHAFFCCTNLASINLPEGLTTIEGVAFGSTAITSIVIPASVQQIGERAFFDCGKLKSGTIGQGSTLDRIGYNVFALCSSLESIVIPSGVTRIENGAFYLCRSLETIYYGGTQEGWNSISIETQNEPLINATVYYYSAEQPATSGNYWHFDTDGVTPVKW